MKLRRLIVSSCCATIVAFILFFLLAVLDDEFSPNLPPAFFRYPVLLVNWPFAAVTLLLRSDPPAGLCWWALWGLTGLFWGSVAEFIFTVKKTRKV
jgi:hypothetical protein